MSTVAYKNTILKALDAESVARLHLKPVSFDLERRIEHPHEPIRHLYFVESGMASLTTTFASGQQVEVSMFGYESVIGISAIMGEKRSLNRIYTQIAGYGYSCSLDDGRREFARAGEFQRLSMLYVQAQLLQAMQSAGCNALHEVDQRLARWLLICADRAHSNRFKMSQEYLSHMLGASRPTVSQAAAALKKDGRLEYSRGTIFIPDIKRLEEKACECYHVIKEHLDNYAGLASGSVS